MRRYIRQRDRFACAPTAIFNAARHYSPILSWDMYKMVERKCAMGRPVLFKDKLVYCPGTQFIKEFEAIEFLQRLGFFKIIKIDVCDKAEHFGSAAIGRVQGHIKKGGTAIIRGKFFGKIWYAKHKEKHKIKREDWPLIHVVFIPSCSKDSLKCVGIGEKGTLRILTKNIKINGFWLLGKK